MKSNHEVLIPRFREGPGRKVCYYNRGRGRREMLFKRLLSPFQGDERERVKFYTI